MYAENVRVENSVKWVFFFSSFLTVLLNPSCAGVTLPSKVKAKIRRPRCRHWQLVPCKSCLRLSFVQSLHNLILLLAGWKKLPRLRLTVMQLLKCLTLNGPLPPCNSSVSSSSSLQTCLLLVSIGKTSNLKNARNLLSGAITKMVPITLWKEQNLRIRWMTHCLLIWMPMLKMMKTR